MIRMATTSPSEPSRPGAGRVALVTGSSRGIGRACVLRLADDGYDIAVHYRRDADAADEVVAALLAKGVKAVALRAEMEDPEDIAALVAGTVSALGGIDVLVANAAATAFKSLLDVEPRHIDRTFATVVRSFILLAQAAAPHLGQGGRVIAMSGMDSDFAQTGHGLLGAAKAAMEAIVRYLAVELGGRGVTVNSVQPGFIASDSSRLYLGDAYDEIEARIRRYTPGGEPGTVDDVAELVAWLCSPAARFVTAQKLTFDGGLSALGGPWADLNAALPY